MEYVVINDEIHPVDTDEDIDAARAMLRAVGLPEAIVYVGDPDGAEGDSYPNGQKLFA